MGGGDKLFEPSEKRAAKIAAKIERRAAKTASKTQRKPEKRETGERILIVSEGSKTEPNYFGSLIDDYELNSVSNNVVMDRENHGSAPINVVNHAYEKYKEDVQKNRNNSYDRVYCLIDKDSHSTFEEALKKIDSLKPRGVFIPIKSIPCFEYWLICHFIYSRAPFNATQNKSSGALVEEKLKELMPHYTKGMKGTFEELKDKIKFAIANATRSLKEAEKDQSFNPTTEVHILINKLMSLLPPQK